MRRRFAVGAGEMGSPWFIRLASALCGKSARNVEEKMLNYLWMWIRGYRFMANPVITRGASKLYVNGACWVKQNCNGVHVIYPKGEK